MIDFSKVQNLIVPEGNPVQLKRDGNVIWDKFFGEDKDSINYVSLGDSIAAGCNIDPQDWYRVVATEYNLNGVHPMNEGASTLFGVDIPYNTSTKIRPNTYTYRLQKALESTKYGSGKVNATSFAMTGATNAKLMEILKHSGVINTLGEADLVTISIGANSILMAVSDHLVKYFTTGDITGFEHDIYKNLQYLAAKPINYYDSNGSLCTYPGIDFTKSDQSYKAILDVMIAKNPKAKYIFTEIYNPYKYLYVSKGENGFFGTFTKVLPDLYIDVDFMAKYFAGYELNSGIKLRFDNVLKEALIGEHSPINPILDNVNTLGEKVEKYVDALNAVLHDAVKSYCNNNNRTNIYVAESKKAMDTIPDRPFAPAGERYNEDSISCAYSQGFDYVTDTNWSRIWEGYPSATAFWTDFILFTKKNPEDSDWAEEKKYVTYDFPDTIEGWLKVTSYTNLIKEIHWDVLLKDICIELLLKKIILQDIDPHPRAYGHYALYRAFADVVRRRTCLNIPNMEALTRYKIHYDGNGGSNSQTLSAVGIKRNMFVRLTPPDITPPTDYCLSGWTYDKSNMIPTALDDEGQLRYYYLNTISSDRTVHAKWSKAINLTYYKLCTLSDAHKLGLAASGQSVSDQTGPVTKQPGVPYYLRFNLIYPNGAIERIMMTQKFSEQSSGYDGSSRHTNRKIPEDTRIEIGLVNKGTGDKCEVYCDNNLKAKGEYILSSTANYKYNPNAEKLPNLNICFVWHTEGDYFNVTSDMQSYWKCWIQDMTPHYKTVTFNSNNGSGKVSQQTITGLGSCPATALLNANAFIHPQAGYKFLGWNTKADGTGTSYSNSSKVSLTSNLTLYAQWSNLYNVTFYKSFNVYAAGVYASSGGTQNETGVQEIYGCDISTDGGATYTTLDPSNYRGYFAALDNKTISSKSYPYGTKFRVWVTYTLGNTVLGQTRYKKTNSHIYLNGSLIKSEARPSYVITLTSDTTINFQWALSGTVYYDATANWNCSVRT